MSKKEMRRRGIAKTPEIAKQILQPHLKFAMLKFAVNPKAVPIPYEILYIKFNGRKQIKTSTNVLL